VSAAGIVIAESLRAGAGLDLHVVRVERVVPGNLSNQQLERGTPLEWTLLHIAVPDGEEDAVAAALAEAIEPFGWYADFRTAEAAWVIYTGRVFRYRRDDPAGREAAVAYGREHGVPDAQLDWPA
jgi:hypothetical protein